MSALSHQPSLFSRNGPFGVPAPLPQMPVAKSSAGRKRSRDEAAVNLDVEEAKLATIEPVKEKEDEWVYGPGMTLIKKQSAYVAEAGSQSGTWLEEKNEADQKLKNEEARAINQQARPSLRTNKSQRLDLNHVPTVDDNSQARRVSPVREARASPSAMDGNVQPIVDNFTLHLGIGWGRISEDEHIQAAARGWARYIENHFPVTNARIQLESRGLQSYLVEANEGFFLFAENLRQGQFVSKDPNQALNNLKANPPIFEGASPMCAAESPRPAQAAFATPVPAAPKDVEMDMS